MEITHIVWTILAGIGGAVVYHWYSTRFVGKFVRKLLEIDADQADTAVTMEDLHCKMTPPLRLALREDGALYEVVKSTEDETPRYYILPEKKKMLRAKYDKEGIGFASVILWICLLIVLGVVFSIVYPPIADYLSGLISST